MKTMEKRGLVVGERVRVIERNTNDGQVLVIKRNKKEGIQKRNKS